MNNENGVVVTCNKFPFQIGLSYPWKGDAHIFNKWKNVTPNYVTDRRAGSFKTEFWTIQEKIKFPQSRGGGGHIGFQEYIQKLVLTNGCCKNWRGEYEIFIEQWYKALISIVKIRLKWRSKSSPVFERKKSHKAIVTTLFDQVSVSDLNICDTCPVLTSRLRTISQIWATYTQPILPRFSDITTNLQF